MSDSGFGGLIPSLHLPKIAIPDPPAKWMWERMARQIIAFESTLSPTEEIGGRFIAAPKEGTLHIERFSYWGPDMLIFHGTDADGRPIQLMQHYSQMSVLLCVVPVEKDKPRRIGFILEEQLKKGT